MNEPLRQPTGIPPLKILKVWSFWQDDIKYHDHYLAESMHRMGISTTFLAPNLAEHSLRPFLKHAQAPDGIDVQAHYTVVRLPAHDFHGKFIPKNWKLFRETMRQDHDVIHIFGISTVMTFIVLLYLLLTGNRTPVIINDHSHPDDEKLSTVARIYYALFRGLYRLFKFRVHTLVVPNLPSKRYLTTRYRFGPADLQSMKMIPLGYQSSIFHNQVPLRNRSPELVAGFAGKIYPEKNVALLLDMAKALKHLPIRFIIAGINPENPSPHQLELLQRAKDEGLNQIDFRPFIQSPEALASYYNQLDVAVFPGSISITTQEASGCGTPVIVYQSTEGLEDRVDHGRGRLFTTPAELSEALVSYLHAKQSGSLDHELIARASLRYSWDELALSYVDLYRQALAPATRS